MQQINRALVSTSDKTGIVEFAKGLAAFGVEMLSTGGTARALADAGVPVRPISDYTGWPEMLDGRVRTLHPKVHGGLLLNREDQAHMKWMDDNNVKPIDIVISNLYPFEKVVEGGTDLETAAENIDIGGPSMTRSAAKAALLYDRVAIITDPAQYPEVIKTLRENNGELTTVLRRRLAEKAFKRTEGYDSAIVAYLEGTEG